MIQIYLPDNTDYEHNGDAVLEPILCECEMVLNEAWHLELEHPIDEDEKFKMIIKEAVISAPTPMGERQLFRIYETQKDDETVTAYALPVFFDSKDDHILLDVRPTGKSGQQALDIMCAKSKYSGTSDITTGSTAYYVRRNLMEAINGDIDQSFINRWGGEILYDNYQVIINQHVGGDYGVRAEFGYNLEGIEEHVDMSEVVTRIIPVAYNGYTLEGDSPWVDSPRINKYAKIYTKELSFDDVKMLEDASEDEEGCLTLEELRRKLITKCNEQFKLGIDLPKISYDVNMVSLEGTEEYKGYEILEKVGLGDTVHCRHSELDIETNARAISIKYDCIDKRNLEIVLGDYQKSAFDSDFELQKAIEAVLDSKSKTVMAEKVRGILDAVNTQLRLQSTVAKKVNGRAFEISDLDPVSELYGCMIFGSQGLQIATERTADGRDWNWRTAITAKGVVADAIISGLLSDKTGRNYWNLDTGEFRMSMEAFTVDGKTVEDIAKGAAGDAQDLAEAYADSLNDFLTGDYKETISEIRTQADNKAEIWRQKEDPAANWGQEEKAVHKGDLWYNTSDQEAYIYTGTAWEIMKAVPPDEIFDLIEGKMQLFSPIPVTPYNVGDLWMTGTVIKVCVQARDTGEYVESDWEKKDNYTDDSYAKQVEGIVEALGDDLYQQLDGKIESYSQSDDPSSAWTQDIQKQQHTGDIWYNTDTKTTKRWSGTVWEELANGKADAAAELAKAKCKVYINQPVPPYRICDLWVQGDIGDIMVSSVTRETGSFVASDWRKASNYSESAYYFLESNINHLEISRADGYIYPSVFTLSAFKQKNGTPPSRGAYKGKIQVYGVYNDGESTTTIYKTTSGTTESTVDIQTSGLDEYTEIRCELWSDVDTEGYIHRLQVIHIPVGRDPLTLNWEETFDMLTNNGKIQGLFAENGQIYINASFIRSGELILGGLNNQYGTFKLKDANDNDIGIWDKQGMTLTNSKGDYRIMFNTSFGMFDNVISVEKKVNGTNVPIAFMKTTGYIGTYNPQNGLGCNMAEGGVSFTYRSSVSGNDPTIGYMSGSRQGNENALTIQSFGVLQLLSEKLVIVDTDPWKAYEGGSGVIKVITQDSSGKQWITTLTYLNGIMVTNLS